MLAKEKTAVLKGMDKLLHEYHHLVEADSFNCEKKASWSCLVRKYIVTLAMIGIVSALLIAYVFGKLKSLNEKADKKGV